MAIMFKTEPEWKRDAIHRTVDYMARRGFHARAIGKVAGISQSQVYTSARKQGIRLRDYRDGKGKEAKKVIAVAPIYLIRKKRSG